MSDTPEPGELIYVRRFQAPRELIFRCLTEPEHLAAFWGPAGTSTPRESITVDARAGGEFRAAMVNDSDGRRYEFRAVYLEVAPPERLVWTEPGSGMTTTSTLTELGAAATELRIHQTNVPEPFRSPQAQAGFRTSLDRFDRYLAALPAGSHTAGRTA